LSFIANERKKGRFPRGKWNGREERVPAEKSSGANDGNWTKRTVITGKTVWKMPREKEGLVASKDKLRPARTWCELRDRSCSKWVHKNGGEKGRTLKKEKKSIRGEKGISGFQSDESHADGGSLLSS